LSEATEVFVSSDTFWAYLRMSGVQEVDTAESRTKDRDRWCADVVVARDSMRIEHGNKRVRGFARGGLVFDTKRPFLVWETPYFPTYYVPEEDVLGGVVPTGETRRSGRRGIAEVLDIKLSGESVPGAALRFPDSPIEELRGLVRFDWDALDEWLEEDEPVYTHPRNPYTRVDILRSSRRIEVVIDGVKVADTRSPTLLFETNLPTRYYIPLSDVRYEALRPSALQTRCPYKGVATYFSVAVNETTYDDLAWIYRTPLPEARRSPASFASTTRKSTSILMASSNRDPRPNSARTEVAPV